MKQMFLGNALLALCAVFYLAWWAVAFKPVGAIKGFASGWLLLPAAACGIAAVALICLSIAAAPREEMLVRPLAAIVCAAVVFAALAVITGGILKRPVTTELPLIVGWTALSVCQLVALNAMGVWGKAASVAFAAYIAAALVVSLACYMAYYKLDELKGWVDGMVPLGAVLVAALSVCASLVVKCR